MLIVIVIEAYTNKIGKVLKNLELTPNNVLKIQIKAYEYLLNKQKIIPFADITNSKVVGFSQTGVQQEFGYNKMIIDYWKESYCLYPGLKPTVLPRNISNT